MSANPSRLEETDRLSVPPQVEPASWGSKLEESWPLLAAGSGLVIIALVLASHRTVQSVDHLSPVFLFLALGITGLAGGLVSFVAGPDEIPVSAALVGQGPAPQETEPANPNATADSPAPRVYGRPVPAVTLPELSEPTQPTALASDAPWSEEAEAAAAAPVESEESRRRSPWDEGRVLHLSDDGVLTVYSVDDALLDLDLVKQIVQGRRVTQIRKASDTETPPTD
jgi:hypothetical protein